MAHYLAITRKPNAVEARQCRAALKAFDTNLTLCVNSAPGAAKCYVEAPDYYGDGSKDMAAKREAVRAIVKTYISA